MKYDVTNKLKDKTEFIAVDFFRLLFALGIVALHLELMHDINKTLNYFIVQVLTRLGVPFFFLVSGFFLQKKICKSQKVKEYVVRLLQLYIIYTILYLPQIIYGYIKQDGSPIQNLLSFIMTFFFIGSYKQLWYFVGLIVATILFYWLKNKTKLNDRYIAVIVLILYVIGTIGNAYIQPLKEYLDTFAQPNKKYLLLWFYFKVFETTRNGIFFGLPYVFFGYLIAKNKQKINRKNYLLPAIASFLLMTGEAFIAHEMFGAARNDMLFFLFPTSIFIFLFIIFIDCKSTDKSFYLAKHLRCLSVLYFTLHTFLNFYLTHFLHWKFGIELNSLVQFACVVILNFIAAEIIIRMSTVKHFQWLKKLY